MRSPGRSTSMVKVMETSAHSRCQYGSIRRREETPPSRKRRPLAVPVRVRRPNPVQRLCTASRPARGTTRITRAAHVRTATPDAKGASHASVGSSKPLARRMDAAGPSGMIRGYCLLPGRVLSSRVFQTAAGCRGPLQLAASADAFVGGLVHGTTFPEVKPTPSTRFKPCAAERHSRVPARPRRSPSWISAGSAPRPVLPTAARCRDRLERMRTDGPPSREPHRPANATGRDTGPTGPDRESLRYGTTAYRTVPVAGGVSGSAWRRASSSRCSPCGLARTASSSVWGDGGREPGGSTARAACSRRFNRASISATDQPPRPEPVKIFGLNQKS